MYYLQVIRRIPHTAPLQQGLALLGSTPGIRPGVNGGRKGGKVMGGKEEKGSRWGEVRVKAVGTKVGRTVGTCLVYILPICLSLFHLLSLSLFFSFSPSSSLPFALYVSLFHFLSILLLIFVHNSLYLSSLSFTLTFSLYI